MFKIRNGEHLCLCARSSILSLPTCISDYVIRGIGRIRHWKIRIFILSSLFLASAVTVLQTNSGYLLPRASDSPCPISSISVQRHFYIFFGAWRTRRFFTPFPDAENLKSPHGTILNRRLSFAIDKFINLNVFLDNAGWR